MSDYTKEIKDSVIDGTLVTIGIYSIAWIGSKIGVSKPSLSISFENIAKFVAYATIADAAINYAKKKKYF